MVADGGLSELFTGLREQLAVLAFSGVGGAFVRAVFAPELAWRRRVMQGTGGALSAVFLGGVVGHVIDAATGAGVSAYLAAGFLMGVGGEAAVKVAQERLLAVKK